MKRLKALLALFLTLIFVMAQAATAMASLLPQEGNSLSGYTVIMHTNDSHARVVPNSYSGYMGFTAVSALKKSYEAAGAKVILLDAGDTLHGLPFANLVQGKSIVEIMNLIGYDAMTPGNHDFNYGTDTLIKLSSTMKFPLISANITKKDNGNDFLKDHFIIEENGVKYGIFGLSTPETAFKTNPKNVATIEFTNPITAAAKEVEELKAEGATVIIALAHLGLDKSSVYTSEMVAEQVSGIDLMIDGHSHTVLEEGKKAGNTLIVSTGDYIENIGVVMIDSQGDMKADLINGTEFTDTDPEVDHLVAAYSTEQEALLSEKVGYSTVYLDGVREHVRAGETNLGDLTADALRYVTGADVAITNGGGIRASIEIGDITKKDIVTVFPFGNYVVTKYVTGASLLAALEQGASAYPEPLGAFLQVSGITYTIDTTKSAGSRIVNPMVNGTALDLTKKYLLASNDFVFVGGDGYTMLADYKVTNEFGAMEDVITEYLGELGDVTIENGKRVTILEAAAGEQVTEDSSNTTGTEDISEGFIVYVVKSGDCLYRIAEKVLDNVTEWSKIYQWNKDKIKDPDKIYIGQKLKVYLDK